MPHLKGFNLLFADGHAKWYKASQQLGLIHFPEDEVDSTTFRKLDTTKAGYSPAYNSYCEVVPK